MKQLREWGLLIWLLVMTVGGLIQLRAIEDLQHQVLQLQAQTKWLEEAIVPKHLQGATR